MDPKCCAAVAVVTKPLDADGTGFTPSGYWIRTPYRPVDVDPPPRGTGENNLTSGIPAWITIIRAPSSWPREVEEVLL